MKLLSTIFITATTLVFIGCDKKNADLVKPLSAENFPQVIRFDDEGAGELEDNDEFSFTLTLNDRPDPLGKELSGMVVPLTEDAVVTFEVNDLEGISNLSDYIISVKGIYEIDDCTTSEDAGIDVEVVFDKSTGQGSVRFPKDVEEIEVVFETDEDLMNDNLLNDEERSISFVLTGVQSADAKVTINADMEFKYEVLDDEGVFGDWEVDVNDASEFSRFKSLFGVLNDDINTLDAQDLEKIEISFEYGEIKIVIEYKETELVEECGSTEEVNKTLEIEADFEELSTLTDSGDLEFAGEVESSDGSIMEFVYSGGFILNGNQLTIILAGDFDDTEIEEQTLVLTR